MTAGLPGTSTGGVFYLLSAFDESGRLLAATVQLDPKKLKPGNRPSGAGTSHRQQVGYLRGFRKPDYQGGRNVGHDMVVGRPTQICGEDRLGLHFTCQNVADVTSLQVLEGSVAEEVVCQLAICVDVHCQDAASRGKRLAEVEAAQERASTSSRRGV